ncbi:molybdopterin converting factor subunit 1 [Rhodospirillaceae bacterium AH-315-P19]|nr:molybdopterin converting factor subunit 1 [Rhodospirillaceae bacterium AH-315-P19]
MKIVYFSWLREKVGLAEEEVTPPENVRDIDALLEWLKGRSDGHGAALADLRMVRVAINQSYAAGNHPVGPKDEVALFPPVTGG